MPNEYVSRTPDDLGFEVRKLTEADRQDVLALIAPGVSEIPIYKWQVGAAPDEEISPELAELCADIVLAPHWPDGVYGAVADDGALLGVIVWSAPDHTAGGFSEDIRQRTMEMVRKYPVLVERSRINKEADAASWRPDAAVDIVLTVIDPRVRGQYVLNELFAPLIRSALRLQLPIILRTTIEELATVHARRWGAVERDRYTLPDGGPTTWVMAALESSAMADYLTH